jgi:site-specific DNA recombinase
MTHTFTVKSKRRYRYYVCNNAQQHGRAACPAPSVPAGEIEAFVVEEIKAIGRDRALVAATVAESRRLVQVGVKRLKAERAALERQRRADDAELAKRAAAGAQNGELARLVEIQERITTTDGRLAEVQHELAKLIGTELGEDDVAAALGQFDDVWAVLTPREQVRVLQLLIERISFDGKAENIAITFHPTGIETLAADKAEHEETAA